MKPLKRLAFRLLQAIPFLRYHVRLNVPVIIGRTALNIPVIEGQYPQYEDYEPWLLHALSKIFGVRNGPFIDVGANRGQTLLKVAALDRQRRYIGFEPNVFCALMTRRIIDANQLPRHDVLAIGLGQRFETTQYLVSATGSESSTTAQGVRSAGAYVERHRVVVADGDSLLVGLVPEGIAVIKIDVEGAELEVLRGLRRTLAEHRPWLIFEVLPPMLVDRVEERDNAPDRPAITARNRERAREIESLLQDAGYAFWNICADVRLRKLPTLDMGAEADLSMSNFIAVPTTDSAQLQSLFTLDVASA